MSVEGVATTKAGGRPWAQKVSMWTMPITDRPCTPVLFEGVDPIEAIGQLMSAASKKAEKVG